MRGTVQKLVADRGFGFIVDEGGREYFFHQNALQGVSYEDLGPGVAVDLELERDPKGDEEGERPRAVNIRLADDAVPAVEHEVLPAEKTR